MSSGDLKFHFGINCLVVIGALGCSAFFVPVKILAMFVMYAVLISILCIGPELKSSVVKYVMSAMAFFFLYMATHLNQKPVVHDWQNKTKYLELNDTVAEYQKTIAEMRLKNRQLQAALDINLPALKEANTLIRNLCASNQCDEVKILFQC